MEISTRMRQIFQVLLREQSAISVKFLAEQIGVSKRTVQRELEYIESSLKPYQLKFVSKTGVGIWLEGNTEEKKRLLADINEGDHYDASNREERRKRLILEILKEKGLRKLYYYSSKFQVSEATISADLESVEGWLKKYGLYVNRKPGSGIEIEGSEANYRKAIRAFINENTDAHVLREAYEETNHEVPDEALRKSNIIKLLNEDIIKRVVGCIARIEDHRVLTMTESSYVGLVIHICIAINRILKNEVIESAESWQESMREDEDYQLAKVIIKELEKEFGIEIPQVEIAYICLHIKGSKHEKIEWYGQDTTEIEKRQLQQVINDMIDAFDPQQAYLIKQDDEFIQGLLAHLQPTFIRLQHGMQIHNPVLADIKACYPEIYARCEKVAKILEESIGKKLPEEEIGFIAVHFGAALVRLEGRNEKIRKVDVGVVCSSGIGISRLLSSKLEKRFRGRMHLITYGKNDITPFIAGRTDFFISSLPLEITDTPVIQINPLLNDKDIERIGHMLYQYERLPAKHSAANDFSAKLEEINLAAAQIHTIIKGMAFFKVDNRISFEELLIAISEKMSPYSDRREYIREDIIRRERISSQIFAELGFALLHTRTQGVIRPEFSICMTKDLTAFQDLYLKGITIVFIMLVPVDEHVQVNNEIMGYISGMLIEDRTFMDTVTTGDAEAIRDALAANLKKYFNKYITQRS